MLKKKNNAKIEWIIIELDLLINDNITNNLEILSSVRRSLNKLLDQGYKLILLSSKTSKEAKIIQEDLLLNISDCYIISNYGANVFSVENNKFLSNETLNKKFVSICQDIVDRICFDYADELVVYFIDSDNNYTIVGDNEIKNTNFAKQLIEGFYKGFNPLIKNETKINVHHLASINFVFLKHNKNFEEIKNFIYKKDRTINIIDLNENTISIVPQSSKHLLQKIKAIINYRDDELIINSCLLIANSLIYKDLFDFFKNTITHEESRSILKQKSMYKYVGNQLTLFTNYLNDLKIKALFSKKD